MAKLAIRGHESRGKEVIKILEMLGANNTCLLSGDKDSAYYVNKYGEIRVGDVIFDNEPYIISTLEAFEEKYPYKVGDVVEFKSIGDANLKSKIIYMEWNSALNKVLYTTEDAHVISTEDIAETKSIPPYMDYEIKENKGTFDPSNGTLVAIDLTTELRIADEVEVILGDYEFVLKDGKTYFVKKNKYPKTYEECCKILDWNHRDYDRVGYKSDLLCKLQLLLLCRDAYWKIAGEEMGLDKPWKPCVTKCKYGIRRAGDKIIKIYSVTCVLEFPTTEMRDEFYKNFKDLIEQCKELL